MHRVNQNLKPLTLLSYTIQVCESLTGVDRSTDFPSTSSNLPFTRANFHRCEEIDPTRPKLITKRKITKDGEMVVMPVKNNILKMFQNPNSFVIAGPSGVGKTFWVFRFVDSLKEFCPEIERVVYHYEV